MAKAWYCSRSDVKNALTVAETARLNKQIDRAINSASDMIEGMLHRKFYPEIATRYFAGGDFMVTDAGQLYLYGYDLLSIDSMLINGGVVNSNDYFITTEPMTANDFPGELVSISNSDEIIITGTFGYTDRDVLETEVVGNVNSTASDIFILDSSDIDVGHTLRIEEERITVLDKLQTNSGQTLTAGLEAKANATLVAVSDASVFNLGEVILIDAEKMLIVDIAGNNLIVLRNQDGSTLATHANSSIVYVPRRLKVRRAVLGTTAAAHLDGTDVYLLTPPSLIKSLCVAEALNTMEQEKSGYASIIGSRDSQRQIGGAGLADIRNAALTNFRKYRSGAV